ncbi:MAG: TlpA family protein disulfide reductase [Cytophagales bacterium]|nr:MAG: TlpA family protein disulfide reductase [Cytophagales bacterium]
MNKLLLLLLTAIIPVACTAQTDKPLTTGTWRATVRTAGGELPFGLDIQSTTDKQSFTVHALNGKERLPMDAATYRNDTLRIPMSLFESEIVARVSGNTMRGLWRRKRPDKTWQSIPFEAQHGLNYRFTPDGRQATANLSGKWKTVFRAVDSKDTTAAVGVFEQQGNVITGTFLTPTGDYRYLAGNVVGDSLLLSCFDGSHLFLFKAKAGQRLAGANRTLTGTFHSGPTYKETWTARFDPNAQLPDPASLTYIKPGQKLAFSFPETTGTKVSLTDDRFKGKVTVVQILGSWCPNCMDETNFLSPWYKKNRSRGVEVVGLAFEKSANIAESGPRIERMKERFKIDYPVLLAGTNSKDEAAKVLPALNRVVAFPTTIIVDKKGQVRRIHTGFSGPGTGVYYDRFVEEFNGLIDKLLAE